MTESGDPPARLPGTGDGAVRRSHQEGHASVEQASAVATDTGKPMQDGVELAMGDPERLTTPDEFDLVWRETDPK